MRSAANVASASSMAWAGSDSPVWPAASMPSSSRRSTVSSLAVSASAIASSVSDTQNAILDRLVAGETTSTSAPRTSSPSVSRRKFASIGSGVTTSSFTRSALPPRRGGKTESAPLAPARPPGRPPRAGPAAARPPRRGAPPAGGLGDARGGRAPGLHGAALRAPLSHLDLQQLLLVLDLERRVLDAEVVVQHGLEPLARPV